jgi:hypothetical protein
MPVAPTLTAGKASWLSQIAKEAPTPPGRGTTPAIAEDASRTTEAVAYQILE